MKIAKSTTTTTTEYSFDGSVDEFKALHGLVAGQLQSAISELMATAETEESEDLEDDEYVETGVLTEAAATVFLTRRPFVEIQAQIIEQVRAAGDTGITSSELATALACEPGSIKSSMRGLGKRAAHTDGWPNRLGVFDRMWEGTENRYRLHPAMRAVLDSGQVKL